MTSGGGFFLTHTVYSVAYSAVADNTGLSLYV